MPDKTMRLYDHDSTVLLCDGDEKGNIVKEKEGQ